MTRVVYKVYHPAGYCIKTFDNRKQVRSFVEEINFNIPSWHYDELYKYRAVVIHDEDEIL